MLKVYIGENILMAEKELATIKESADPYNYVNLNGDDLKTSELASHCQIMPFFGGQKTICIRSLLKRFERGGTVKESKSKAKKGEATLAEQFSDILNALPDFADVILLDSQCSDSNSLLKSLPKAQIIYCQAPKGTLLTQYIENNIRQKGGKIEKSAALALSALADSDMLTLEQEIDKLLLYAGGHTITNEDLQIMCSLSKEQSIFALVDAVIKKDGKTAEKMLLQMFKSGQAPAMIIHMLIRSYRIMLLLQAARAEGYKGTAVKNRVDQILDTIIKPFEYSKLEELSRAYTLRRLQNIYRELLQNDMVVKTGQMEAESAVGVLVSSLVTA